MNPSRVHLERGIAAFAASLPEGARVLDVGAGDCRYKPVFEGRAYESSDFASVPGKRYAELDHICDITAIPVEDGRYQGVLCSQVLAHVPDPVAAARELARVLAPGGELWLSAPLYFQPNEPPYDFHRFTRYGLARIAEEAGLEVISIEPLDGYAAAAAYSLRMGFRGLPLRGSAYGGGVAGWMTVLAVALSRPWMAAFSELLARADVRHRITDGPICKNYVLRARHPGDSDAARSPASPSSAETSA
ncbi:MAG: class I SAM-dependent methyltransferase [Phycisphaerales bacterium]